MCMIYGSRSGHRMRPDKCREKFFGGFADQVPDNRAGKGLD